LVKNSDNCYGHQDNRGKRERLDVVAKTSALNKGGEAQPREVEWFLRKCYLFNAPNKPVRSMEDVK